MPEIRRANTNRNPYRVLLIIDYLSLHSKNCHTAVHTKKVNTSKLECARYFFFCGAALKESS